MASPIYCDNTEAHPGADTPIYAVMLLNNLEVGQSFGLCGPCYIDLCRAMVHSADEAIAEPTTAATDENGDETDEDADADAVRRLQAVDGPATIPPSPSTIVRRGTSRSRAAYEARKREKGAIERDADSDADGVDGERTADVSG